LRCRLDWHQYGVPPTISRNTALAPSSPGTSMCRGVGDAHDHVEHRTHRPTSLISDAHLVGRPRLSVWALLTTDPSILRPDTHKAHLPTARTERLGSRRCAWIAVVGRTGTL